MAKDEWVRAALTDDVVVVELLLRLKQPQAASATPQSHELTGSKILLSWGLKQPRTKTPVPPYRRHGALSRRKDSDDAIRFSPTTPLSWSGRVSPSATTDGSEESSRLLHSSRSEPTVRGECNSNAASVESSRRRKNYDELREVECSLIRKRIYLRKEVDTLHATKGLRAANRSLKIDFVPDAQEHASRIPYCLLPRVASQSADPTTSSSCDTRQTTSTAESSFLLPDLNMTPAEDESPSQTFYGML